VENFFKVKGAEKMENFFKIRAEKQSHIIDAAFRVFGRQGYRKASLADIAQEAGITKGMITYYFGSKKNLYLYLVDICRTHLEKAVDDGISPDNKGFFEKVKSTMDIQVSAIKEHPAFVSFAASLFCEADPEVAGGIEELLSSEYEKITRKLMTNVDAAQFKPGVDSQLVSRFTLWACEGFVNELYETALKGCIDDNVTAFYNCLDMMKAAFCNE